MTTAPFGIGFRVQDDHPAEATPPRRLPHREADPTKVIFCVHGVISPLLANLYMRRFVLGWKKLGLEKSLGTRIVTYADDLVILCRKGRAAEALQRLRDLMGKLKLTVNEEKTRICKVPEGEFDFLGYTFGRMYSRTTGKARLGMQPSKKSIRRMVEKIHAMTAVSMTWQGTTELVRSEEHTSELQSLTNLVCRLPL